MVGGMCARTLDETNMNTGSSMNWTITAPSLRVGTA
jgi:hypothetical protein